MVRWPTARACEGFPPCPHMLSCNPRPCAISTVPIATCR
jgi:hypothetical protein